MCHYVRVLTEVSPFWTRQVKGRFAAEVASLSLSRSVSLSLSLSVSLSLSPAWYEHRCLGRGVQVKGRFTAEATVLRDEDHHLWGMGIEARNLLGSQSEV